MKDTADTKGTLTLSGATKVEGGTLVLSKVFGTMIRIFSESRGYCFGRIDRLIG